MVDAGDAVRAELREHEQALLEEQAAERDAADQAKLQVMIVVSLVVLTQFTCDCWCYCRFS